MDGTKVGSKSVFQWLKGAFVFSEWEFNNSDCRIDEPAKLADRVKAPGEGGSRSLGIRRLEIFKTFIPKVPLRFTLGYYSRRPLRRLVESEPPQFTSPEEERG